ncbi:hypothetical protein, partial [Pseudomonas putida]|uniref:hypothetical protein n=1 Tax=Pseudomonas putida TaxID=303 RepID=UPI0039E175E3
MHFNAFYREDDFAEGDPEEFLQHLPDSVSREQVATALWSHANRQLVRLLVADPERIELVSGRDKDMVLRVLDQLSLMPESLSADAIPHFFMGNPIWSAPCINTGNEYLLPIPHLVLSHIHGGMRALLDDRVRSMNPTYHMMGQQVTVASLASSSTAEELRSRPPTMHTA